MTAAELRASLGLAGIFGLRMLGMFIILPVFALYAEHLPGGNNHTLIGLALGAYGLTQACLQIPFGALSDHWGRKRTIYLGLLLFAMGSFMAAGAHDLYMVIVSRVVQGAGAISAAVLALAADLTRDEQRSKAMAIIGITIGATFALSLAAGPLLSQAVGVPGVFALTGVLALLAIAAARWIVPDAARAVGTRSAGGQVRQFSQLLRGELARLNFGIFVLHAVLMGLFVVVPFELRESGLPASEHWKVYLPVVLLAFVLMLWPMTYAERAGRQKLSTIGAIVALLAGEIGLAIAGSSLAGIVASLLIFFTGLNLLEATLPSLVSRVAPSESKGAAVGIYSSVQFFGAFVGAVLGGFVSQHLGSSWVFGSFGILTFAWLLLALTMTAPARDATRTYPVPLLDAKRADGLSRKLASAPGVREALIVTGEGVARLKVDDANFDERAVLELIAGEA
ncbi:MAG: MFS transporter [Proteobacteria bacterium]|nr:MAG: MFS transporter [Pseudomonadota bacterium]